MNSETGWIMSSRSAAFAGKVLFRPLGKADGTW